MRSKRLAATSGKLKGVLLYPAKDVPMNALDAAGRVTLNAEGKQYAASYQLQWGVITVTSEFASRVIRVGETVAVPESLARTILRAMVSESCQSAERRRDTGEH
jgi:hypothetical protein